MQKGNRLKARIIYFTCVGVGAYLLVLGLVYRAGLQGATFPELLPIVFSSLLALVAVMGGVAVFKFKSLSKLTAIVAAVFVPLFVLLNVSQGELFRIFKAGYEKRIFQMATPSQWDALVPLAISYQATNPSPDYLFLNNNLPPFTRHLFTGIALVDIGGDIAPDNRSITNIYVLISGRGTPEHLTLAIFDNNTEARNHLQDFKKVFPISSDTNMFLVLSGGED